MCRKVKRSERYERSPRVTLGASLKQLGVWWRCKPLVSVLGEGPENLKLLVIQDTFGSHLGLLKEPRKTVM